MHVGRRRNEVDLLGCTFEGPKIAIAPGMAERFDGSPSAVKIHQDRRIDLVPIPRIIWAILEVVFDFARVWIQADDRGRVKVVAWMQVAWPRRGIAGAPIGS